MKPEPDSFQTRKVIAYSKSLLLVLLLLTSFQMKVLAQCAENLTFNYNNLSYWSLYLGTYSGARANNAISSSYNLPPATVTSMRTLYETGTSTNAIEIFRNQGASQSTDALAPAIKTVPNINGYQYEYAVKLGSNLTGSRMRRMVYRVNVPANAQAYTITYAYALVLQDPGHAWDQQPRFTATVRDPSKPVGQDTIKCASVQYFVPPLAADKTNQGFVLVSSGLYYKNWAEASVDIAGYAGKTIILEFETEGCSQSGHYGYAYFALRNDGCSEGSIAGETNICNTGSFTYSTPPIVGASYTWTLPSGWTGSSTSNSITVTPNNNSGYITVTPSQSCGSVQTRSLYVKSQTTVPSAPGTISGPTSICNNSTNITYSISPVANATSYAWTIPSGWTVVSGGTSTSITVNAGSGSGNISVVAKNGCGNSSPSSTPLSIVASTPSAGGTITTSAASVCAGTSVTLTNAGKTGAILAWQRSYDGGQAWSDIAGQTGTTYTETSPTQSALYRVRVQNGTCLEAVSGEATLAVNALPNIDFHPSNVGICTGASASFTVSASGAGLTYQWQRSTNGSTWTNITAATTPSDGVTYSNFTTATLTISSAVVGVNNYQYRCVVSGTCSPAATSNAAVLTVSGASVSIGTQPTTASVCQGSTVNLSMAATGTNLTYQWYSNTANSNTGGIAISGETSNSYSFNASTAGTKYYYVVATSTCSPTVLTASTNAVSVVTTASSTVSVSMAANPTGTLCAGTSVTFTATPTNGGTAPTYVWTKNGTTISGQTAATYTTNTLVNGDIIGVALNSDKACAIGNPASSAPVTMSVRAASAAPTVTATGSLSLPTGGSVTLSASAGSGYKWYKDGNIISGATSATYAANTAGVYTATITDANSCNSTISNSVTVIENDPNCSNYNSADFIRNGDATVSGSVFTLTPNSGAKSGSVWSNKRVFLSQNFDITTKVYLGNSDAGADGIAFVLQDQSINAGSSGGGLGYAGITPSFAVEFDTYNNGSQEPSGDHIALIKNGNASGVHNTYASPYTSEMEDGAWHTARFVWNASAKTFQVWYDGVKRFDVAVDLKADIFSNKDYVYWGFTGATGGAMNLQQVEIVQYCYTRQVSITPKAGTNNTSASLSLCTGSDVVLEADLSNSYQWYKNGVAIAGATNRTITVSEAATYKVEAVSTLGSTTVSENAVITVNSLPTAPVAVDGSRIGAGTVNISATVASGNTVDWYAASTGGSVLANGQGVTTYTTPSLSDTTTYYAVARNTTSGCLSGTRTAVVAIVTLTIDPTITLSNITKNYTDSDFAVSATSNSSGQISYTSSNSAVATISGNTVTIKGVGVATITAAQVANGSYNAKSTTATLTVNKVAPTVTLADMTKVYGNIPFAVNASSASTGAFTYTSSNTSVATISGNTITIVGVGVSTINVSQAADNNYLTGSTTAILTVTKAAAGLSLSDMSKVYGNAPFTVAASSSASGAITYTSSNTSVATISGNTITITGAGTATITASQVTDNNYSAASTTANLVVAKANPVLTLSNINKSYGDAAFNLNASSASTGAITYASNNANVATISGSTVTIRGAGIATISVSQAADNNYNTASTTAILTVAKAYPTIIFADVTKSYDDDEYTLVFTSNSTGVVTYSSSDTTVGLISANVVKFKGGGTATLTAMQSADNNYNAKTVTATLTITKGDPGLSLANMTKTYGTAPYILSASTKSSGTVTYTSSDASIATISGNTITVVGAGTCTIGVSQVADNAYQAATTSATLTVTKAVSGISFANMSKTYGDAAFAANAITSSNGAIVYTSSNTNIATISGNTITIVGAGSCTITANQVATANYNAGSATANLVVAKATPTITLADISKTYGDADFSLNASSNSNGAINYVSANATVLKIVGTNAEITGSGTTQITVNQLESTNYLAASKLVAVTIAKNAPTLVLSDISKTYGDAAFTVAASTNSNGAISYSSSNTSVATISGNTVTIVGAGTATITASQVEYHDYTAATTTATLTVARLGQQINITGLPATQPLKDFSSIAITATSSAGLPVTLSLQDGSAATLTGGVGNYSLTSIGQTGSVTIVASQAGNTNYLPISLTVSFDVVKSNQTLAADSVAATTYASSLVIPIVSSASSGLPVSMFVESGPGNITDGNKLNVTGAGTIVIHIDQMGNEAWNRAPFIHVHVTINKANPTIVGLSDVTKTYGDPPFTLNASSNSTGLITYSVSDTAVAHIVGNQVRINGAGTAVLIAANQVADNNYNSANDTATLTVNKANPSLSLADVNKTYGDASFDINAGSNSTGVISYSSSNTNVATISGNTVTIVGAGSAIITATQVADNNYLSGSTTAILTVAKATPTVSLANINKVYGNAAFNLQASSNSSGALTYTSSDTSIATVSGNTLTIVGAGSATITVNQQEDANYLAGTANGVLTVAAARPTISLANISKVYGDEDIILAATTNSTGAITYYISDEAIALAHTHGSRVCILGAGTVTIKAVVAADNNYLSDSTTATLTIAKANPAITLSDVAKVFGDEDFVINANSNSTGSFIYTSSNTNVATITGNTVTVVGAGTATITASQATDNNYNAGSITATLTVDKANSILSLNNINKVYGDSAFVITASGSGTGLISYSSSNTSVAAINGNTVTIVGAGNAIITATRAATANYNSGSITATLTVDKANPTISLSNINKEYGDTDFSITATSNSTGALTYTLDNAGVASISGNTVHINASGSTTITVSQVADANYLSGTTTAVLSVGQDIPAISLANMSKTYGDSAFVLHPTTNSTGSFTYTSSNPNVATISGDVVTIVGVGTATITANQAADNNYSNGTTTATLTVVKANASLVLADIAKTYGDAAFSVNASSNSAGAITYTSSNTNVATISGNTITIVGAGSTVITASQVTDNNYNAASVTANLVVVKAASTITLADMNKTYGDAAYNLNASSNSTGAITYSSSNTSVATISGNTVTIIGAGASVITASQFADNNYNAVSVTANLVVAKASATISLADMNKTYGDVAFSVNASSNSTGAITYTSSNTNVATISGNTITIVGAGNAVITASQVTDNNYNAASVTANLVVVKAAATISLSDMNKTYGDAAFSVNASSSSTGAINYSSSNANVATISGNTITIVGAGSAVITASQVTDNNYNAASVTANLVVAKAVATISLADMNKTYGDAAFNVNVISNATGVISYSSSNANVATISGNTITIVGAGNATITASQAVDVNYNAGITTANLTVAKANPTITLGNITKTYGDAAFSVNATSNSTGTITYTSSNTNVAEVNGNIITIVGAGSAVITASQVTENNYNAASVTANLVVGKAAATISLSDMAKTYGDAAFNLNATSNGLGEITYSSSNTSVATISGNKVSIVGAGSAVITASQLADNNYNAASVTANLVVAKAAATISLADMNKTYGNAAFSVNATSNSTGAISYSSSNASVATISGNTITIVGAGAAVITASQLADNNYNAASVTANLVVAKAAATISLADMNKTYGDAAFNLNATSNSTGAITYSSSNINVATISGNTITIVGAGTAVITASQAADNNYNVASVTANLVVAKAAATISLTDMSKTFGNAAFSVNASSNSTGAITYSSSNTSVATISGNTITIVGAGTAVITASQGADNNYNVASVTANLVVSKAAATIGLADMNKTYGNAAFDVNASSNSTGAITYSSNNTSVATISGNTVTIVGAGTTVITVQQEETDNYVAGQITARLQVNKQKVSIAIEDLNKNYGDADMELKPSSESQGAYSFVSSNSAVARISGSTLFIVGAGKAVITVQQAETENYAANSKDIQVVVAKAPLMIVADDKVKCNGTTNPVFTFKATGFVRNDDLSVITRKPEFKLIGSPNAENAFVIRPIAAEAKDYVISYGDGLLTEYPINPVRVEPDYAKVAKGTTVTIRAFGNASSYQWNAVPGILTSLDGDKIVARVFNKTSYAVTMTDANGCKTSGNYEVDVNEEITVEPAIILSPNGDGRNDKFVIGNIDLYPENKLQVFDRTGKLLYEAVNYRNNWDGRVNGVLLTKDNYFYILTVKGQVVKRGSITVVR